MALIEIFFHIIWIKWKDAFLFIGNFHHYITVQHLTFLGELSQWTTCWILIGNHFWTQAFVCQILAGEWEEKKGNQGTNITLICTGPVDLFLIPYFWPIFGNFQNEADCLSISNRIDRNPIARW